MRWGRPAVSGRGQRGVGRPCVQPSRQCKVAQLHVGGAVGRRAQNRRCLLNRCPKDCHPPGGVFGQLPRRRCHRRGPGRIVIVAILARAWQRARRQALARPGSQSARRPGAGETPAPPANQWRRPSSRQKPPATPSEGHGRRCPRARWYFQRSLTSHPWGSARPPRLSSLPLLPTLPMSMALIADC